MKLSSLWLALIFLVPSVISFAQPKGIHLSWNGSSNVQTATTIAITWLNDKQDKGIVRYGIDSSHLNAATEAVTKYSNDLHVYISKADLLHLKPASHYFYKVGSNNGWSNTYTFKTAPVTGDTNAITVGVWSDTQNNGGNLNFEQTDTIVQQLRKYPFNFMLHTGDIVENGSVESSWKKLFDVAQPLLAKYPFMPVIGNHDVVNDTASAIFQKPFPMFYDLFNLPLNQLNYSYDYGNTHFIAINSGFSQGAEKVGKVLFDEGSPEKRWLQADLKKARGNKNTPWIILYCHYPMYSFGVSHIPTWQQHITPLLDEYSVDLCLSGHRHVYERHKAIKGGEIFEQQDIHVYDHPKGTVYITNGSCGGSLQGTGGSELPTMLFTPAVKIYTYAVMRIEGHTISYNVYDKEGNEVDHCTIVK